MPTDHLLIFVKNPIPGTVKTRIARTVGDARAVAVYKHLLRYTQQVTHPIVADKTVYYADVVNPDDGWNGYGKALQQGQDLGERMANAFREQFAAGAGRAVIIGSDCLTINALHIEEAFRALDRTDVVIGPATDGGYYLLGMRCLHEALFADMPWSQPELLSRTEAVLADNRLTFTRLEPLTDIDEWADYEPYLPAEG